MSRLTVARLRDLIRSLNYVVSLHAAEELEDDNLSILDLENIILTGRIVERQKDRQTNEAKVVSRGRTLDGREGEVVCKVGPSGALYIITVYFV